MADVCFGRGWFCMAKKVSSSKGGGLGPLEYSVACVLWACPERKLKVREIHRKVRESLKKRVPLTSVAVMLDRLHKKGVVSRQAEAGLGGYHYLYSTKASKGEFERSVMEKAVDGMIEKFGTSAVSYFNERFSKD